MSGLAPFPLPIDGELLPLLTRAAQIGGIALAAGSAVLTWCCLALSARWNDVEERLGPAPSRPERWR
jgi:hypothetical protein